MQKREAGGETPDESGETADTSSSSGISDLATSIEQVVRAALRLGGTQEQSKPVLTVDEAARLLDLDRKTVYALIDRKELPGVRRFGKTFRISREALMTWMYRGRGS